MFVALRVFAACLFALASATSALASDLPRFDGVYIQTTSGEFVELRRYQRRHEFCHAAYRSFTPLRGNTLFEINLSSLEHMIGSFENRLFHIDSDEFSLFPIVPHGAAQSIFIRSRTERLARVQVVALSSQYFEDEVTRRRIHVALDGRCRNEFREPYRWPIDQRIPSCLANYPSWHLQAGQCRISNEQSGNFFPFEERLLSGYVLDICGWNADSFRLLNETETTWQYFPHGGDLGRAGERGAYRFGRCGSTGTNDRLLRMGTAIITSEAVYLVAHFSPDDPAVVAGRDGAIARIRAELERADVFYTRNPVE